MSLIHAYYTRIATRALITGQARVKTQGPVINAARQVDDMLEAAGLEERRHLQAAIAVMAQHHIGLLRVQFAQPSR